MNLRNISDRDIQDLLNMQVLHDIDDYFRSRYIPRFESAPKRQKDPDSIEELLEQVEHNKKGVNERIIDCLHKYIRKYGSHPNTVMLHPRQYHELVRGNGSLVELTAPTEALRIYGMEVFISQDVEDVCVANIMRYI